MTDTSGGGKGKPTLTADFVDFMKKSSYWAAGGLACYSNYFAMKTIVRNRMVRGGPAVIFVALFGYMNSKGYKYANKQIKENAKDVIRRRMQIQQAQKS